MTEAEAIAALADHMTGAAWLLFGIREAPWGAPHGHPSTWVWQRTRLTLHYALQGFIVRPHERTA